MCCSIKNFLTKDGINAGKMIVFFFIAAKWENDPVSHVPQYYQYFPNLASDFGQPNDIFFPIGFAIDSPFHTKCDLFHLAASINDVVCLGSLPCGGCVQKVIHCTPISHTEILFLNKGKWLSAREFLSRNPQPPGRWSSQPALVYQPLVPSQDPPGNIFGTLAYKNFMELGVC